MVHFIIYRGSIQLIECHLIGSEEAMLINAIIGLLGPQPSVPATRGRLHCLFCPFPPSPDTHWSIRCPNSSHTPLSTDNTNFPPHSILTLNFNFQYWPAKFSQATEINVRVRRAAALNNTSVTILVVQVEKVAVGIAWCQAR